MKKLLSVILVLVLLASVVAVASADPSLAPFTRITPTPKPLITLPPKPHITMPSMTKVTAAPEAKGAPVISKQPKDQKVKVGGKVNFALSASGSTGITWRLMDPATGEIVLASKASSRFKGLKVSGQNSKTLRLSKVPAELDGWLFYCTLSNKKGSVVSRYAELTVTDKKGNRFRTETPSYDPDGYEADDIWSDDGVITGGSSAFAGDDDEGSTYAYTGSDDLTVTVVGATIEGMGGTSFDFTDAGEATFKVKAAAVPEYWVINGAKYLFNKVPKTITVKKLTYPLVIEAVMKGAKPQTLLSEAEIQARRTGETLLATGRAADLCHTNANRKGAGGWFREFDFTNDFQNRATSRMEKGGRVTLNVRAAIPEGKRVSYWEFNGAKLDFSTYVTQFHVENLNETMEYHPVFYAPAPTATPVPMYTVKCTGCEYSTGDGAWHTSGQVPAGTKITLRTNFLAVEMWKINGSVVADSWKYKTLTRTINTNTTVICTSQIN